GKALRTLVLPLSVVSLAVAIASAVASSAVAGPVAAARALRAAVGRGSGWLAALAVDLMGGLALVRRVVVAAGYFGVALCGVFRRRIACWTRPIACLTWG